MKRLKKVSNKFENSDKLKSSFDKITKQINNFEESIEDFSYELKNQYKQCDEWLKLVINGKIIEAKEESEFIKESNDKLEDVKKELSKLISTYNDFFEDYEKLLEDTMAYNKENNIVEEKIEWTKEDEEKSEKELQRLMKSLNF